MMALLLPPSARRALVLRALVLWGLLRMLVTAIVVMGSGSMPAVDGVSPHGVPGPSPIAVVVLCTLLALVDVRRRRERALWANLGASPIQLALLFALVAAAGEMLLAVVVP